MTRPVRVAICEDSRAYAEGLRHFLEVDGRLEVVAVAESAERLGDALARVRADLVTMDLELPGIDGVQAIERIMATRPVPIVVVSAHSAPGTGRVAAALAAGALSSVAKSDLRFDLREGQAAVALRRQLVDLARGDKPTATAPPSSPTAPAINDDLPRPGRVTAVGIGASAGGPHALAEALGLLPETLAVPVLVVQHMSKGFMPEFVAWLDSMVAPPVRIADDGAPAGPHVTFAPDGAHLLLDRRGRLRLDARPAAGPHQPSADALLDSLAREAGRGALAVILTGMGRDGADGAAAVRAAGGVAITENSEQAMLSAMPAAAEAAGATPLSIVEIARTLAAVCGKVTP
jgi:two-component system chemotaxis response regulator CheB